MRQSRMKDKFSPTFSKFSQNCENFENTSENLSFNSRRTHCDYIFNKEGKISAKPFETQTSGPPNI